jgi:hypothetical protein
MSSDDLTRFQSMSMHDLYEELGRALVAPESPTVGPVPKSVAVERGQLFLATSREKLKTKICVEWNYCGKRGSYGNVQALLFAISPLISTEVGVPAATAIIVAMILIKMGLDHFCNCPSS